MPTPSNEISTRPASSITDCRCLSTASSSRASTSAASADPLAETISFATIDGRPVAPGKKKFGSFASEGARDSATYSASGSINYSDLVLQQHTNFLRSRLDKNTIVYL